MLQYGSCKPVLGLMKNLYFPLYFVLIFSFHPFNLSPHPTVNGFRVHRTEIAKLICIPYLLNCYKEEIHVPLQRVDGIAFSPSDPISN